MTDRTRVPATVLAERQPSSGGVEPAAAAHARTASVLLVEDDDGTAVSFGWALRSGGLNVVLARSGQEGVTAARHATFDLLIVDLRLPDLSGIELMRQLRVMGVHTPFIVVSGHTTVSTAVEAMQLGAATVLEKPLDIDDLVAAVHAVINGTMPGPWTPELRHGAWWPVIPTPFFATPAPRPASAAPPMRRHGDAPHGWRSRLTASRSTAERWAMLVLRLVDEPADPRTLGNWARAVNVSRSALSECCRLVHVSPHDARDFARTLRAVSRSGETWRPEAVIDVADARTLRKLLARAGLAQVDRAPTVEAFLDRQQWIPRDNPGLVALRALVCDADGDLGG